MKRFQSIAVECKGCQRHLMKICTTNKKHTCLSTLSDHMSNFLSFELSKWLHGLEYCSIHAATLNAISMCVPWESMTVMIYYCS